MNKLDHARELQNRTKKFAIQVIQGCALPRSKAEFIAKLDIVVEEADETLFWLDLLADSNLVALDSIQALQNECLELLRIFASSLATAKSNRSIAQSPVR